MQGTAGFTVFLWPFSSPPLVCAPCLLAAVIPVFLFCLWRYFTQYGRYDAGTLLAGVASAGMMIFGSALALHHAAIRLNRRALFRRRGRDCTGQQICVGGFTLCAFVFYGWGRGAHSILLLLIVAILIPPRSCALPPAPLAESKISHNTLVATGAGIVQFFAGFRLHIVIYLPLMAKRGALRYSAAHLWSLGRHGDHSSSLRLAVGGKTLSDPAMPDRQFPVDQAPACCCLSPASLLRCAAVWFWRHVYGHKPRW